MATNTAASFTNHTGNATAGPFSISFSYLDEDEVDVSVGGVLKTKTTHYTFPSATTISFTSGNHPGDGVAIKFQRNTDISAKKVDFQDGSVLTESDLDNNSDQILYGLQEHLDTTLNDLVYRDGSKTFTGNIVFEGATDDAHETTLAITDPTADRTITLPNTTGTVVTTGDTGTVTSTMINDGTIVAGDLASDSVTTAKVADDAITSAKIADGSITSAHIAADTVVAADIAANAVGASELADDAVDTAAIANLAVTNAKLGADAVNGSKIADDSINSEHYVDGSIDTAHIADSQVTTAKLASNAVTTAKITDANITTAKIADDAVTAAKIADGSITSAHIAADTVVAADIAANAVTASELADNAVDTAAIAADAVTGAKIADDAINSEHYTDGSIDTAHIADAQITTAKIADDAVTAAKVGTFNLADLTNVHTSSPNDGQVLKWINSNSRWEPANDAGAGGATLADADYGEITVSSSGAVFTIDNDVITSAKIADDAVGAEHIETLDANLDFADGARGRFGTDNDLQIYHSGSHGFILNGTGNLDLRSGEVGFYNYAGDEVLAKFTANGAVELRYDNVKKFETKSAGVEITGQLINFTSGTAIALGDSSEAKFGSDADLAIYHDGSNSYIDQNGTGDLLIRQITSGSIELRGDTNELMGKFRRNLGVELYYDNSKKLHTHTAGITVTGYIQMDGTEGSASAGNIYIEDNGKAIFGNGSDLQIYHDGTNSISIIDNNTGWLQTLSDNHALKDKDGGDNMIVARHDGAVELYFDGSKKLETYSSGVEITGDYLYLPDNIKLSVGSFGDLQIYHDESNNWIKSITGQLKLETADSVQIFGSNSETLAQFSKDGAAQLYYDNSLKLATTSSGVYFVQTAGITSDNDVGGAEIVDDANGGVLRVSKKTTSAVPAAEFYNDNGRVGQIIPDGSSTTFSTTSDYRLKENQVAISDGITRLKTLKPYRFNFKADPSKTVDGFFAHEVTAVPEAVYGTKDGTEMQSMDYGRITPLLTAALKEAIAKIETLETKVAALESA